MNFFLGQPCKILRLYRTQEANPFKSIFSSNLKIKTWRLGVRLPVDHAGIEVEGLAFGVEMVLIG